MADNQDGVENKTARSRQKFRRAIPTDRVNFGRQLDILRATAVESGRDRKPVTNDAVAKVANLHAGSISICNPFFLDAGLLVRHKMQNIPCDEVFAFADSYEWDKEKAALKLAPVIRRAWFSIVLMPKLNFRPLPIDEALGFLAEEAGATKGHRDQLATILEYMKAAGVIATDGGIVTLNKNDVDDSGKEDARIPAPNQNELSKSDGDGKGGDRGDGDSRSGESLNLDPLILALLQKIPHKGELWQADKRLRWFKTFAMNVSQVYDEDNDPVELKIEQAK